jgi:hypothetical protein
MYLDNLLSRHLRTAIRLDTLYKLRLLKLGPLSYGGSGIAIFIPPFVAPFAPPAFQAIFASYK